MASNERNKIIFQFLAVSLLFLVFLSKSALFIFDAKNLHLVETKKSIKVFRDLKLDAVHDKKWLMVIFIFGTEGDDLINARALEEVSAVVFANAGNDLISGGADNDWLFAGAGADTVDGFDGFDRVFGGPGRDQLVLGSKKGKIYGSRQAEDFTTENCDYDFTLPESLLAQLKDPIVQKTPLNIEPISPQS